MRCRMSRQKDRRTDYGRTGPDRHRQQKRLRRHRARILPRYRRMVSRTKTDMSSTKATCRSVATRTARACLRIRSTTVQLCRNAANASISLCLYASALRISRSGLSEWSRFSSRSARLRAPQRFSRSPPDAPCRICHTLRLGINLSRMARFLL